MDASFVDRTDAGRRLAQVLERFRGENPVVLGLPRGGMAVAAEVARALGAPLDVVVVRKVAPTGDREFGTGAVTPDGALVGEGDPEKVAEAEREVARRLALYRGERREVELRGRLAILVDDGLASGVSGEAAAAYVREREASRVVLAVPVAAPDAGVTGMDEVVALVRPDPFRAVADAYGSLPEATDEDVRAALKDADTSEEPRGRSGDGNA